MRYKRDNAKHPRWRGRVHILCPHEWRTRSTEIYASQCPCPYGSDQS